MIYNYFTKTDKSLSVPFLKDNNENNNLRNTMILNITELH